MEKSCAEIKIALKKPKNRSPERFFKYGDEGRTLMPLVMQRANRHPQKYCSKKPKKNQVQTETHAK
jgi:hypothetical protein